MSMLEKEVNIFPQIIKCPKCVSAKGFCSLCYGKGWIKVTIPTEKEINDMLIKPYTVGQNK